jgi:hypothetical protein
VGPRTDLNDLEKRKILPLLGLELRPIGRPSRSQSYTDWAIPAPNWLRTGRPRGRSSSPGKVKTFFSTSFRPAPGPTQPPIQWVPGPLSPGVKRQGRVADHSPPDSGDIKKMWIYTSIPPYAFMT